MTIVLLTDFGTVDPYLAAMKGVLVSRAPQARLIDLTHDVAPGDVRSASFLLAAAAPYWPAGTVFLAVVDPGVGSDRRLVAARRQDRFYVAPDNGLLGTILEDADLRSIERPDLYLDPPSSTFHGRDRLAPAAAWLATGGEFEALGPLLEAPVRLLVAPPRRLGDGRIQGHVAHIDRFGNAITDVPGKWLPREGCELRLRQHRARRRADYYAAMAVGEPTLLVGSMGTVEISLRGESLAHAWGVESGDEVWIVAEAEA